MLLTLTTPFNPDCDAKGTEVLACDAQGKGVMRVKIDFADFHVLSYELLDEAGLMSVSIARVMLAAAELVDEIAHGGNPVWEVEV